MYYGMELREGIDVFNLCIGTTYQTLINVMVGNVSILHTNNTSQFGTLKCRHRMKISRMSVTCNIDSGEVWSSYSFSKNIEIGEKTTE